MAGRALEMLDTLKRHLPPLYSRQVGPLQDLLWTFAVALDQVDTAEALAQLLLSTATGEYLNIWGQHFNLARNLGESDSAYRQRIIAIVKNITNNIDIQLAIQSAFGVATTVGDSTTQNNRFVVRLTLGVADDFTVLNQIKDFVRRIRAAGTCADYVNLEQPRDRLCIGGDRELRTYASQVDIASDGTRTTTTGLHIRERDNEDFLGGDGVMGFIRVVTTDCP